jgi:DNA-binding IclR family transcriptional regulator
LRSTLLRAVMAFPGISAVQLAGQSGGGQEAVERNLSDLVREGFLSQTNGRFSVCHVTKKG